MRPKEVLYTQLFQRRGGGKAAAQWFVPMDFGAGRLWEPAAEEGGTSRAASEGV